MRPLCAAALAWGVLSSAVSAGESYKLAWTWGILEHPEWCENFRQAGMNAVTVPIPEGARNVAWWKLPTPLKDADPLLEKAAQTGLRGYVQVPLGMGPGTKIGRRLVTADGFTEPLLACPLSREYLTEYLIPAVTAIARQSLGIPALRGVILDTEQYYGKERSGALNEHYCFCDGCFGGFWQTIKAPDPLPEPKERLAWLEQRERLQDYWKYLEDLTAANTQELARAVKAVAPEFEVHFYVFDDTWFYRGLLRGLRALDRPVMVCDERSYNGFLKPWAQKAAALVRELNPNAVWSPGFYTEHLSPRIMKTNIRMALAVGDSFWIYNNTIPFPFDKLATQK